MGTVNDVTPRIQIPLPPQIPVAPTIINSNSPPSPGPQPPPPLTKIPTLSPAAPAVNKAPSDNWKTPLNYDTHENFFGPGPKSDCLTELKAAIKAKTG